METRRNMHDQPIGPAVENWSPRSLPPLTPMVGRYSRVEPLDIEKHAADLHAANRLDGEGKNWTYLNSDPFNDLEAYRTWLTKMSSGSDPMFHAIIDARSGKAAGVAAYLRIDPANGVIEVGHINLSPLLQRTVVATEAMYLMMSRAFDELGYRRYEWKCDDLNAPSIAAAKRLGFTYEGTFRQALVYKGRNRDTAWYSIVDSEWPARKKEFERWLSPENFDGEGRQRTKLAHGN